MPNPMSAASSAAGPAFACPEWCKLPSPAGPVPVPYPNAAKLAPSTSNGAKVNLLQTQGLSKSGAQSAVAGKVVTDPVDKAMLRNMASQVPASTGDEAGAAGGVVSGAGKGGVAFKPSMGSSKVMLPSSNSAAGPAGGSFASPSQAKIMIAP